MKLYTYHNHDSAWTECMDFPSKTMISNEDYSSVFQCWLFHQQNLKSGPIFAIFPGVRCFPLAQYCSWLDLNTLAFSIYPSFQFFQYNYPEKYIYHVLGKVVYTVIWISLRFNRRLLSTFYVQLLTFYRHFRLIVRL